MNEDHLSNLPYISREGFGSADTWLIIKTVLAQITEYPTWEPDHVGDDAYNKQVMHMYCLLEEAFNQGRLSAKADVMIKFNSIIELA